MSAKSIIIACAIVGIAQPALAEDFFVHNQSEYAAAASDAEAGDTITLADGEWRDFEMVISGSGRADAPITVAAQTPGRVILSGRSNLRIGGEYIVVSGLVFRDGYSPTGEVISFRRDSADLANHSRVTQTVIDRFNKPDRNETDYWVAIYGRNNRFDHNHMVGKTNRGVTMAVRLNTEESRENNHRIDHNYFGPRPNLGSNGGETLRIGTSHYAEFDSNTVVENNVFDRCSGEVEIISSKSGGNTFRGNLFLRSRGAMTLRHGDGNLVERNVFLGGGEDHTGGIRIINRRQTVRDNYMEGLRGSGFASALTVMNGVPDSPADRYVQVIAADITGNTIVDSDRITLGAGADGERSAAPVDSVFADNLLDGTDAGTFFEVVADISGIAMSGNVLVSGRADEAAQDIARVQTGWERGANGLLYPIDPALADTGAPRDLHVLSLDEVGVDWYAKPAGDVAFGSGNRIVVPADGAALRAALETAGDGDTIVLAAGVFEIDRTIPIRRRVTLAGASREETELRFARPSLFELQTGGALQLLDLTIDGGDAPDSSGNAVIRTGIMPVFGNLEIAFDGIAVRNLDINRDFHVISLGYSTLAEHVRIADSEFSDISGSVVSAHAEYDDQGRYNVEYLDIANSTFRNVRGPAFDIYRGGRDESTFGPHVAVRDSQFDDVGTGTGASFVLHGVQDTVIAGNSFENAAPLAITHTVGVPLTAVRDNTFIATPPPVLVELNYLGEPRVEMEGNSFDGSAAQ